MNMLIEELNRLSDDPKSWVVVLLLAGFAVHAAAGLFLCPYVKGTAEFTEEEIAEAKAHRFTAGSRFFLTMLAGIALTISGLFMIAYGIKPAIALAALVAGVVLIHTEPARLQLREQKNMVVASIGGPPSRMIAARERLRGSHVTLAVTNIALVLAVAGVLLAF